MKTYSDHLYSQKTFKAKDWTENNTMDDLRYFRKVLGSGNMRDSNGLPLLLVY